MNESGLTMLEVQLNVVASDIGSHSDDRSAIKLANKMTSRHAIQIWHYNIHQNEIVFGTTLNLVHSLQTIKLKDD
jgi:hypothetical protein